MPALLTLNTGRIMTHELLLRRVWGEGHSGGSGAVRAIVKRLRRKLGDDVEAPAYIFNKPRFGYGMERAKKPEPECPLAPGE